MTYLPTSRIGRLLATLWLSACLGVLLFGFIQRGIHDMPIAFYWFMIYLTVPIGLPIAVLIGGGLSLLSDSLGLTYHPFLGLLPMWIACVIVGYFQWFIALPWVILQILKKMTGN